MANVVVSVGTVVVSAADVTFSRSTNLDVAVGAVSISAADIEISTNTIISVDPGTAAAASSAIGVSTSGVVLILVEAASVGTGAASPIAGQPNIHVGAANVAVRGEVGLDITSVLDKSTYRAGWINIRSEQGSRLRRRFAFTNTDGTEFDLTDYGVFMVVTYGGRRNQETISFYEGNGLSVTGNAVYLDLPSATTATIDDDGKYRLVAVSSFGKRELLLRGKFHVRMNAGR